MHTGVLGGRVPLGHRTNEKMRKSADFSFSCGGGGGSCELERKTREEIAENEEFRKLLILLRRRRNSRNRERKTRKEIMENGEGKKSRRMRNSAGNCGEMVEICALLKIRVNLQVLSSLKEN